ncbi:MAG: polysaccharide deacetylase family protein [Deltaproteobacteria bacterium]|nr:polysaccharide deacetylase family protein [Deltaproteobacteria bacterium]
MASRLAAVSVDLDEIPNYYAIHGRAHAEVAGGHAVYDVAVPRLRSIARALDVPLTLFAVGNDLARPSAAAELRRSVEAGHAVGNHTQSHLYDLTRRDRAEIAREIDEATTAIERATGARPRGFRAPGYTITDEVFSILPGLGYRWDSSVFPCPAYMVAKDLAIAAYGLLRRPSRSIVDTPAVLTAPTRPYRVGTPYWRRGAGLLELPIQVTRRTRLPYIGTSLMLAGPVRARWLTHGVIGEPLVNLELHGIDVLDAHDGLSELASSQRDLRVPSARKQDTLASIVELLRLEGYAFVTLDEAAEHFAKAT